MSNLIHMEPEQVRTVAQQLNTLSEALKTHAQNLSRASYRLDWSGGGRDAYVAEIDTVTRNLTTMGESAGLLSLRVQREVDEWEQKDLNGAAGFAEDGSIILGIAVAVAIIAIGLMNPSEVYAPTLRGESVIGAPDNLEKYYKEQVGGTCGFQATQNILKAFGKTPTLTELKASAGYGPDKEGTKYGDYEEMFEANGIQVDSHKKFSSDEKATQQLVDDLKAGKAVLARIDVKGLDTYWGTQEGGHAVWVTGVRTDADGNITHFVCNDSGYHNDNYQNDTWNGASMESGSDGIPDGQGIEYGADEFLDAWEEREYSYIVTRDPMP